MRPLLLDKYCLQRNWKRIARSRVLTADRSASLSRESIELSGIVKDYHTAIGMRRVLDGISFSIGEGEKIGVLGKNGAGKSTLVKIIGGVEPPTSGKVERGLFMSWPIAFGGGFGASMSGFDNIQFIARLYDVPIQEAIARRVRKAVRRSVHDLGNHRQRAYRPRTDTWNQQQFGEVDRRPIRCGSQIGIKARLQHVAWANVVMGRHHQMRQRKLRRNGWCDRSFNPARQNLQFARDPVWTQGVQNAKLTAARSSSTAIGEIDDLTLHGSVTLPNRARNKSPGTSVSSCSDDFVPCLHRRGPKASVRSGGGQVALDVEGVVDGGVG